MSILAKKPPLIELPQYQQAKNDKVNIMYDSIVSPKKSS
jgi:hypothetical protein